MDRRKFNGGPRPGSGRPPKAEEAKVQKIMDNIAKPEEAFQRLWELCQQGDIAAVRLWLSYRIGLPKASFDITSGGEKVQNLIQAVQVIAPKELVQEGSVDDPVIDITTDEDND